MSEKRLSFSQVEPIPAIARESRPTDSLREFGFDLDLIKTVFETPVISSTERPNLGEIFTPEEALAQLRELFTTVKTLAPASWENREFLAEITKKFPDIASYYTLLLKVPWGYHLAENVIAFRTEQRLQTDQPVHLERPAGERRKSKYLA